MGAESGHELDWDLVSTQVGEHVDEGHFEKDYIQCLISSIWNCLFKVLEEWKIRFFKLHK